MFSPAAYLTGPGFIPNHLVHVHQQGLDHNIRNLWRGSITEIASIEMPSSYKRSMLAHLSTILHVVPGLHFM